MLLQSPRVKYDSCTIEYVAIILAQPITYVSSMIHLIKAENNIVLCLHQNFDINDTIQSW